MARISGVNIPTGKKIHIALTYIFGIGSKIANDLCDQASIDKTKRVNELNDDELNKIREIIDQKHVVEGDLRRKVSMDIKRLNDLGVMSIKKKSIEHLPSLESSSLHLDHRRHQKFEQ